MQIKDPKPEIMRLEELALLVKSGDIKLPRFQRPFVWKQADMLKLRKRSMNSSVPGVLMHKLICNRSWLGLNFLLQRSRYRNEGNAVDEVCCGQHDVCIGFL